MKSLLGLDIGSHSIKLVELAVDRNGVTLLAAGIAATPSKALTSTVVADTEALSVVISKLAKDLNVTTRFVNAALPESQVFTRIISVPQLSDRELASAMQWEAEQYIPLPLDQVSVDYSILRQSTETGKNTMDVLLVASPKSLVEKYIAMLTLANLNPVALETEIIASCRALVHMAPTSRHVMVISIGAKTTDIAILRDGKLSFIRSMSSGGEAISRLLAQSLGFELSQAEAYKRAYGVEPDKLEGKILASIKPILDTIISEIQHAITFYTEKYPDNRIDTIFLSGGTARLPGLVVYLAQSLTIEVQLADPFADIRKHQNFNALEAESSQYTVAVGLALRNET